MTKQQTAEQQEAIENLKTFIKPSGKVIIFITHVSRSGMSRRMKVYSSDMNAYLTWNVAKACGLPENDQGVLVTGCGMDMAFWLADSLTYALGYKKSKQLRGNGGTTIDWKCVY